MTRRRHPPPPSLQALVGRHGTYAEIPREVWAEYDAALAQWHLNRRIFTAGFAGIAAAHARAPGLFDRAAPQAPQPNTMENDMTIDMRTYGGETFVTVDDVRDGPLSVRILDAREGKFDKPDLVFESGDVLSLNATNRKSSCGLMGRRRRRGAARTLIWSLAKSCSSASRRAR